MWAVILGLWIGSGPNFSVWNLNGLGLRLCMLKRTGLSQDDVSKNAKVFTNELGLRLIIKLKGWVQN